MIETAWFVFAGRISFVTIAVFPRVPAIEINMSSSCNSERIIAELHSFVILLKGACIFPFTEMFSTLTKLILPSGSNL